MINRFQERGGGTQALSACGAQTWTSVFRACRATRPNLMIILHSRRS